MKMFSSRVVKQKGKKKDLLLNRHKLIFSKWLLSFVRESGKQEKVEKSCSRRTGEKKKRKAASRTKIKLPHLQSITASKIPLNPA